MSDVWRMVGVCGCYLVSALKQTDMSLVDMGWYEPTKQAVCPAGHAAPRRGCQCGMWASPTWEAFAAWVREVRHDEADRLRVIRQGMARYSRAEVARGVSEVRRLAGAGVWDQVASLDERTLKFMETGQSWQTLAVVRCSAQEPVEPMHVPDDMAAHSEAMVLDYMARYQEPATAALQRAIRHEMPAGFFRYRSLTIREMWLSGVWADQQEGLRQRYRCPVRLVDGDDWVARLINRLEPPGMLSAAQHAMLSLQGITIGAQY